MNILRAKEGIETESDIDEIVARTNGIPEITNHWTHRQSHRHSTIFTKQYGVFFYSRAEHCIRRHTTYVDLICYRLAFACDFSDYIHFSLLCLHLQLEHFKEKCKAWYYSNATKPFVVNAILSARIRQFCRILRSALIAQLKIKIIRMINCIAKRHEFSKVLLWLYRIELKWMNCALKDG